MELHPGVFVSDVATEEWEPDPDVPGSEMHVLVDSGGVQAGLTRITKGDTPLPWTASREGADPGARGRGANRDRERSDP